jgi:hypothetical protein
VRVVPGQAGDRVTGPFRPACGVGPSPTARGRLDAATGPQSQDCCVIDRAADGELVLDARVRNAPLVGRLRVRLVSELDPHPTPLGAPGHKMVAYGLTTTSIQTRAACASSSHRRPKCAAHDDVAVTEAEYGDVVLGPMPLPTDGSRSIFRFYARCSAVRGSRRIGLRTSSQGERARAFRGVQTRGG